jgi:hypothetical protein
MDTGYRTRFKAAKYVYRWMQDSHGEWAWWLTAIRCNDGSKLRRAKPQYSAGPLR